MLPENAAFGPTARPHQSTTDVHLPTLRSHARIGTRLALLRALRVRPTAANALGSRKPPTRAMRNADVFRSTRWPRVRSFTALLAAKASLAHR